MRKNTISLLLMLLVAAACHAQSAKTILDRAAAVVSNRSGITARFQMISKQHGSASGQLAVKGNKFHATTTDATIWFDGKTQWTYMKNSQEVNVSTPSEAELQAVNPYNFIHIYKKGFSMSSQLIDGSYIIHLLPTDKTRKIEEMYIHINKSNYHPTHVKMRRNGKWSVIIISQLKTANISDAVFQFNAKDFPQAEVIDLR